MARRGYEEYDRDMMRDRRRDPRDAQREQDVRDRLDGREHRRVETQDRMDYSRDGRPDIRTTRDPTSRPVRSYADEMDRDDLLPRGYMDEMRDRHRTPIDLQPERREEPASRYLEYFLPGEGINREVIQYDICRYLGNDATVRPYDHPDGRRGFLIKAYRAPTSAMILTLKQDSKRYENEAAQRRRQHGQSSRYGQEAPVTRSPDASLGMSYGSSATFDDRERIGRPDAPPSGYTQYPMDTPMDDYEDDRGGPRGHRDPEPRIDPRMEVRQEPRQPVPINRHAQMPALYQAFPQDPAYSSYQALPVSSGAYDQASQPRTVGPNNDPAQATGRAGQAIYSGSYPVATSAGYSIPTSAATGATARYADAANGRIMANYSGAVPYVQDRHTAARR